jgi:hypothetical protein
LASLSGYDAPATFLPLANWIVGASNPTVMSFSLDTPVDENAAGRNKAATRRFRPGTGRRKGFAIAPFIPAYAYYRDFHGNLQEDFRGNLRGCSR